jgi:hypothetical protein
MRLPFPQVLMVVNSLYNLMDKEINDFSSESHIQNWCEDIATTIEKMGWSIEEYTLAYLNDSGTDQLSNISSSLN